MADAGRGCHAKGVLPVRGGGTGSVFQRRSQAEMVGRRASALLDQAWGVMVDGSSAEGGVRKGAAARAIGPGCC